jgi:carboxylesterase type B
MRRLAAEGIVVVSMNYRMGAMGFLADGRADGLLGNYGFLDQVHALRWVQKHIAKFGGDPSKVTLMGQSAGGSSVAMHMTYRGSTGLFHAAVLNSSPYSLPYVEGSLTPATLQDFSESMNCVFDDANNRLDLECIRSKDADLVRQADVFANQGAFDKGLESVSRFIEKASPYLSQFPYNFGPVVDNATRGSENCIVCDQTYIAMIDENGPLSKVPVMTGFTMEEGVTFARVYWLSDRVTSDFMNNAMINTVIKRLAGSILPISIIFETMFGDTFKSRVFAEYPPDFLSLDSTNNLHLLSEMFTEMFFQCPARKIIRQLQKHVDVYPFMFDATFPTDLPWGYFCAQKACHGVDLAYFLGQAAETGYHFVFNDTKRIWEASEAERSEGVIFRNPDRYYGKPRGWEMSHDSDDIVTLNDKTVGYLTRFIKTKNPNGNGAPAWEKLPRVENTPTTPLRMHYLGFDESKGPTETPDLDRCDLWDEIEYFW